MRPVALLKTAVEWCYRQVFRRRPVLELGPPAPPAPAPPSDDSDTSHWRDVGGGFYFRKTILEHLDEYFLYIRRMRRADPDAYDLYSKVGASLLPPGMLIEKEMSAFWRAGNRPGFGAVGLSIGLEGERDFVYGKFAYFRKFNRPPADVERTNGDVYEVVIYYDDATDPKMGKYGYPRSFYVGASPSGDIRLLKVLRTTHVVTRGRDGHKVSIPQRAWVAPNFKPKALELGVSTEDYVRETFAIIHNTFEQSNSHVRVAVTKGRDTASFGIDIKRVPYFFSDREKVTTAAGKTARIFHIVRAHRRVRSGSEKYIKFHFRGLRDFEWNGYQVHVSVPGKHHNNLPEFTVGQIEVGDDEPIPPATINTAEAGARLQRHLAG